jgi:SAM-dependent methyltransferase
MSKDVGKNFASVSTNPQSEVAKTIYEKRNSLIAKTIIENFPGKKIIDCLELGGGAGALVKDLKNILKDTSLRFTNIDRSEELISKDEYSDNKFVTPIEDIDVSKLGRFDVILIRYVLNYNDLDTQKRIVEQAKKLLTPGGIFILHHVGAKDSEHKDLLNRLFTTDIVSTKLIRSQPYWLTWKEVENILVDKGLEIRVLAQYQLPIGSLYKERYDLTDAEEEKLHDFLGKYDFYEYVISKNTLPIDSR